MAEIIGVIASGITLAALFKTCIEAFEIIQTGHNQELDLRKLVLRLNIEKCRLFTWGESMGLTDTPEDAELNVSASCQFKEVVTETLETIFQLFSDSKKLQDRYGCKEYLDSPAANSHEQTSQVKFLAAAFDNFKIAASWRERRSKVLIKARWAIHDRKKFASFISEIKELVDGLQHITQPLISSSHQGNAMKRRIENINDAETLDMVSDVCQEDHSELSRIALARAETISSTSTNRWNIDRWDYRIEAVEMEEMVDLELLNITELKHQMFRMMRERRELESQLQQLRGSVLSLPIPSSPLPVVQKIAGSTLSSPTEDQKLNLGDAEENVADTAVPIKSPAWKGLEQNSSNDDHADDLRGQLAQSGQSGPSCSANVSAGLVQDLATWVKALPTVRDHTSDQLGPEGDEYIPREFDEAGEKKVDALGYPQDGRQYRCRTFTVPGRDKLFMLATQCARVLSYRDSYLLFNKNRSLYKIIATQKEKEGLIEQEILPFSYRSRQIAIVTARSMFRQFGSRVIVGGRRVRDDYWESKARKQGFTEEDPAGEKRPRAIRIREAAVTETQVGTRHTFSYGDVVYSNGPGFEGIQPPDSHLGLTATMAPLPMIARPRQDMNGPPC